MRRRSPLSLPRRVMQKRLKVVVGSRVHFHSSHPGLRDGRRRGGSKSFTSSSFLSFSLECNGFGLGPRSFRLLLPHPLFFFLKRREKVVTASHTREEKNSSSLQHSRQRQPSLVHTLCKGQQRQQMRGRAAPGPSVKRGRGKGTGEGRKRERAAEKRKPKAD